MMHLSDMEIVLIISVRALRDMMDDLEQQSASSPDWHLSVDFEGVNLSRHGEICIGQFAAPGSYTGYIVDFVDLNPLVKEPRLAMILSSEHVLKLLFDPRNDADALGSLSGVKLRRVLCLQLADAAHRKAQELRCRFVRGLAAATQSAPLSASDRREMERMKNDGKALFCPELGGSYEVFKSRPLDDAMQTYCAADVYFFDEMKATLLDALPTHWKTKVTDVSRVRVNQWKKPGYVAKGRERAVCPL